jgi:hypothetical protein
MNGIRLCFTFGMLLIGGYTMGAEAGDSVVPEAEEIVASFERKVTEVAQTFETEVEGLRSEYDKEMVRLADIANVRGGLTIQLWANRNLRVCREPETEWLSLFEETYEVPEALAKVNAGAKTAINTLRERGLTALAEAIQSGLDGLTELEKRHVRADQIDQALQTRKTRPLIEKSKSYPKVEKRLKGFTTERAAGEVRKRNEKREWDPVPPPDAEFPFKKDNPAFQALLKSVSIESSGFMDGPSARIALGNAVNFSGNRGLAVVAVISRDVLIQDSYDTYAFEEESLRLIDDLKALPYGSFLLLAVRDDATRRFTGSANSTLIRFGAGVGINNLPYRSSYLMIGVKGLAPGEAMEMHNMGKIGFGIGSR